MRRALLLALALMVGCAAPPPWSYESCVKLCRPCGVIDCGEFCGRLDDRMVDPECAPYAEVAWSCTEAIGCDFPLQCRPSLAHAIGCGQ